MTADDLFILELKLVRFKLFHMRVNGNILKCGISRKQLIAEQTDEN